MDGQLGERLVQARGELGLTQKGFADATGVPLSTLKKYEGSHTVPGYEALRGIAKTGINVHWLLTSEGAIFAAHVPILGRPAAPPGRINVDALLAAFDGCQRTAPADQPVETTLRHAVDIYYFMLDKGMITLDGVNHQADIGKAA